MAGLQVVVTELKSPLEFEQAVKRERLQVIEIYTEWAGPTQACKSAWKKLAVEMGGGPLPFDIATLCLDRYRVAGGASQLAAFAATSEPHFVLFKRGKQVAAVSGLDLPALHKAAQKFSADVAVVRESES